MRVRERTSAEGTRKSKDPDMGNDQRAMTSLSGRGESEQGVKVERVAGPYKRYKEGGFSLNATENHWCALSRGDMI